MLRTYRFRLFPNVNQTRELERALESHRRLYNQVLDGMNLCWENGARWSFAEQSRWYTIQRRTNPHYTNLAYDSGTQTLRKLDKAMSAFFRRLKSGKKPGFPRFKGKDRFDSFHFRKDNGFSIAQGKLRLFNIGTMRVNWHRSLPAAPLMVTVKREAGKWFAVFVVDAQPPASSPHDKPSVGIDVGLESFLTTSDGEHELNPQYLKESLPKLRIAQRAVSRKNRGGSNRRKAICAVKKIHAHVRNQRREHHYQVACRLLLAYGLIVTERLNIAGMGRNRWLSRAIHDVAWGNFVNILKHKAESAGAKVIEVDPRGTSQECSQCGTEVRKELSERRHVCNCGLSIHRDHNAARNILARGLARTVPAGANVGRKAKRSPRSLYRLVQK